MKNVKKIKGFTLVELIVVMVILAILVALMVPSLTKYIDKANNQSTMVEARYCLTALQTFASETYGKTKKSGSELQALVQADLDKGANSEIYAMAECPYDKDARITSFTVTGTKISEFTYKDAGGSMITWTNGTFGDVVQPS